MSGIFLKSLRSFSHGQFAICKIMLSLYKFVFKYVCSLTILSSGYSIHKGLITVWL